MANQQRPQRDGIFDHAKSLVECANASASLGHFGVACALLVLSLEEFMKYQIVLSNSGEEKAFSEKILKQVFHRHDVKHSHLQIFQQSLSAEAVESFYQKMLAFDLAAGVDPEPEQPNDPFGNIGSFLSIAFSEINLTEVERLAFIKWLDGANDLKKKGFYVDEVDGVYTFPNSIDKTAYDVALKYAVVIQNQTQVMRDLDFTEDEFFEWLKTPI